MDPFCFSPWNMESQGSSTQFSTSHQSHRASPTCSTTAPCSPTLVSPSLPSSCLKLPSTPLMCTTTRHIFRHQVLVVLTRLMTQTASTLTTLPIQIPLGQHTGQRGMT